MRNGSCVLIVFLILIISGCATGNRIPLDYSGVDTGYAIISIGHTKETQYSSYKFLFRTVDKKAENMVGYWAPFFLKKHKGDFENDRSIGTVELLRLPPGEYEIYNFDIFMNLGLIQTNYKAKTDFSIPFIVKPNEATYIGEYIADNLGHNFIDASIGGAYFIISDKKARDVEIVNNNNPNIEFIHVSNAVPSVDKIGCPLLTANEIKK